MFEDFIEFLWIYIAGVSLVGIIYAGERFLNALPFFQRDLADTDTKLFNIMAIIASLLTFVVTMVLIIDPEIDLGIDYHWFTIILLLALTTTLIARPLAKIPGYALVLLTLPILILTILILMYYNVETISLFSVEIELWVPLAIISAILVVITAITYFVEKTIVDPILQLVGNAIVTIILSIMGLLHAILLFIEPENINGLLEYLKIIFG